MDPPNFFTSWLQTISQNFHVELDSEQKQTIYQQFCNAHESRTLDGSELEKFSTVASTISESLSHTLGTYNVLLESIHKEAQLKLEEILVETEFLMSAQEDKSQSKRKVHDQKSVDILTAWLTHHSHHPYPSPDEKIQLSCDTGLSEKQVDTWFANARRRKIAKK